MLNYDITHSTKAFKVVELDIKSERVSHAYLFISPDDNYLISFAKDVAAKLLKQSGSDEKSKAVKIEKDIHPDVLIYGRDSVIGVSEVADIISRTQISPFEADNKIFILLRADEMNEASQNKILKTIEEPPENTVFLLCASGVSKILPTILSRVKQIELDEISTKTIENMLIFAGIDRENAEILSYLSNGNASTAEKLSHDKSYIELFSKLLSCFCKLCKSHDVLSYSAYLTAKEIDKNEIFDISFLFIRDILFILSGKEELAVCKSISGSLKAASTQLNIDGALKLLDACKNAKKELQIGTNPTAVVDNFLFKIVEVKVKCKRSSV